MIIEDFSYKTEVTHGRGYVYRLQYHLVWCVKYRQQVLVGDIEEFVKKEFFDISDELGFTIDAMEFMPDHVHLLISCTPQHFIPTIVKILKGNSARHLFMYHPEVKKNLWGGHLWNPSYFVATVSENTLSQVEAYIKSQKTK